MRNLQRSKGFSSGLKVSQKTVWVSCLIVLHIFKPFLPQYVAFLLLTSLSAYHGSETEVLKTFWKKIHITWQKNSYLLMYFFFFFWQIWQLLLLTIGTWYGHYFTLNRSLGWPKTAPSTIQTTFASIEIWQ